MKCWLLHKRFWVYITSSMKGEEFSLTRPETDEKVYVYCQKCGRVYRA